MKKFSKILSVALLVALVLSLGVASAFADALPTGTKGADKTITITPPEGLATDATNTYTVYKVFNATSDGTAISYKSIDGTAPDGFVVDDQMNVYLGTVSDTATEATGEFPITVGGATKYIVPTAASELTATQIENIKNYSGKVEVGTVTVTGSTPTTVTVPDFGYYYIATTTGTVVTIDSTNKSADVRDKNEVPPLTKKITDADSIVDETGKQAIAQVGKDVEYTITVVKKHGAENYEVHDTMDAGLKYKKDVKVFVGGNEVAVSTETVKTFTKTTETDNSLVVTFDNDYIAGLDDETVITLVYHCTVTEDALQKDPAKNTAYLTYGHTPGQNHTPPQSTETFNAKFSVTKHDGNNSPLAGAGFVLTRNVAAVGTKGESGYVEAHVEYYKYVAATGTDPEKIEWVTDIAQATEYVSGNDGKLNGEFTGLCNGTYVLVEKTVPTGYNKAADFSFTVADKDVSENNLIQSTDVINNQGSVLPSTGGIGTTIFYVVGGVLVLAAIILLVTKKRMSE